MVITVISPGASKMPPHDGNVAKFTYATSLTVRDTTGILAGWHLLIGSERAAQKEIQFLITPFLWGGHAPIDTETQIQTTAV